MSATLATTKLTPSICTNGSCIEAISDVSSCECPCGGVDHALELQALREVVRARSEARIAAGGDPFRGAADATNNDDEIW